jgi:hypothetical protein
MPCIQYGQTPEVVLRHANHQMFTHLNVARLSFAERFPCITIALIAATLFAITMMIEIECLRMSGYFWR